MLAWLERYHGITLQVHLAALTGLYFELKSLLQIEHTSCACLNTESGLEALISVDCPLAVCNSTARKGNEYIFMTFKQSRNTAGS